MQKPSDKDLVDSLIASSLRKAMRIELLEPADPPYVAEALATQLLIRRETSTYSEAMDRYT